MLMEKAVAVVTGGASGLGEATVRRIVEKGGRAAIFDLSEVLGRKLEKELGDKVIFIKTDVVSEESVTEALEKTISVFGKTDLLVNCAGIGTPQKILSKKGVHSLEAFSKVIQVNLVGMFNVIRLAAQQMAKNEPDEEGARGVIINTSSIAAYEGQIGQAAYSASKAGVVGLTLPIARELAAYGIRVVTITPGLFETPMFATVPDNIRQELEKLVPFPSRFGRPAEFAQLVQCILQNNMINGCAIRLDGAIRMQ